MVKKFSSDMFAEVAIPKTNLDTLTYSIPAQLESLVKPGSLVKIKLKEKLTFGIVIKKNEVTNTNYAKDIVEVLDSEFLSKDLLSLIAWAKKYYFTSWGPTLNLTIPQSVYSYKPKTLDIKSEIEYTAKPPTYELPEFPAVRKIINNLKENRYKSFLLFNPNNKESVEIYLRIIEEALRLKKSTIMLVPEIILTPKFITRFKERLANHLFCLHSGLKLSERKKNWHEIRTQAYSVVLGTRSAIFAPVNNLGLIIVDTEHDLSYKEQERHFHYNARDIAVVRAQMTSAITVLASATPSVESFYNTTIGKYELINIPKEERKIAGRVILVNMRRTKDKVISPKLKYEIKSAYEKGKQIVLFLNRRGFARAITCTDCGYIPHCPNCRIPLVLTSEGKSFVGMPLMSTDERRGKKQEARKYPCKSAAKFFCNLCKYKQSAFDFCPECKGNDFLYQGIGTQKVVSEVKRLIPSADILRLDKDSKHISKTAEILITTRLGIRGLDFSQIGLFGIISADTTLFMPDFRAQEKTFQELSKIIQESSVNKDCKVIIQSYRPDNYAIYRAVQGNYIRFYEQELETRKKLGYPPFMRLALIKLTSTQKNDDEKQAGIIMKKLGDIKNLTILGPSLSPISRRPNTFTYQILVKMKHNVVLSNLITYQDLVSDKVKIDIDIDPV